MRASIVIASHNEGECLINTIKSCIDTTIDHLNEIEIVVVDDASTDGSMKRSRDDSRTCASYRTRHAKERLRRRIEALENLMETRSSSLMRIAIPNRERSFD